MEYCKLVIDYLSIAVKCCELYFMESLSTEVILVN